MIAEHGDEGIAQIQELTNGLGGNYVLECVGTQNPSCRQSVVLAARR